MSGKVGYAIYSCCFWCFRVKNDEKDCRIASIESFCDESFKVRHDMHKSAPGEHMIGRLPTRAPWMNLWAEHSRDDLKSRSGRA